MYCPVNDSLHDHADDRAANGGALNVLGSGVTLTNLTGNIFQSNTADDTLTSALNDGEGGMGEACLTSYMMYWVDCTLCFCLQIGLMSQLVN